MRIWLLQRELDGPPGIVGYATDGSREARGPSGEVIEFAQVSKPLDLGTDPPVGAVVIRRIRSVV